MGSEMCIRDRPFASSNFGLAPTAMDQPSRVLDVYIILWASALLSHLSTVQVPAGLVLPPRTTDTCNNSFQFVYPMIYDDCDSLFDRLVLVCTTWDYTHFEEGYVPTFMIHTQLSITIISIVARIQQKPQRTWSPPPTIWNLFVHSNAIVIGRYDDFVGLDADGLYHRSLRSGLCYVHDCGSSCCCNLLPQS